MNRLVLFVLVLFLSAGCVSSQKFKYRNAPWFERIPSETTQVVRVKPIAGKPYAAELTGWEFRDGMWYLMNGPWKAVIGANGLAAEGEKREGDKKTPAGLFPLRRAFGRYMFCPSRLPYVRMSKNDIWIDDPSSPDYNTLVKGESTYSHEKMLRADGLYDYGVVIEYNTIDIEPNKGSAIFMHVWRDVDSPTAGCVAVSRAHMMQMLSWLESAKKPAILLGEDLPEKKKSADEPTYDVSTAGS